MERLKNLLEQQGRAFENFKKSNDIRIAALEAKGHGDPLLEEMVDKQNREISELQNQIDELVKKGMRPGGGDGYVSRKHFSSEDLKSFGNFVKSGAEPRYEQKALSTDSGPDGGFAVPQELEFRIGSAILERSPIRRLSRVVQSFTADHTIIVNQGGTESGWIGEREDRDETDASEIAAITIPSAEMYAKPKATQRALDDIGFDAAGWIEGEIVAEFSRREGLAFLTGNGVKMPKGILDYDTVANASYAWGSIGYIASGAASTFTNPDKLIDLQHALKSYYRNGAVWVMSDATQAHVRKFKDGDGNYLWRPGLDAGSPNTLLGKTIEIDDNMPSIGTDAYPVMFANLKEGYTVVDRTPVQVLRDPYTAKPYVLFYCTKRVGGAIVDYRAIKLLKVASS